MISLYRDPEGLGVFSSAQTAGNTAGTGGAVTDSTTSSNITPGRRSIVTLAIGIDDTKVIIQKLENRVAELKEELEQYEVGLICTYCLLI